MCGSYRKHVKQSFDLPVLYYENFIHCSHCLLKTNVLLTAIILVIGVKLRVQLLENHVQVAQKVLRNFRFVP